MYIDRLVEGGEGARAVGGEQICLISRPHWFMVARDGVRGLLLMGCGIVLLLFREPLIRQLEMLVPYFLVPRDSLGPTPVPLTLADFQLSVDAALAWGGLALGLVGVLGIVDAAYLN